MLINYVNDSWDNFSELQFFNEILLVGLRVQRFD